MQLGTLSNDVCAHKYEPSSGCVHAFTSLSAAVVISSVGLGEQAGLGA